MGDKKYIPSPTIFAAYKPRPESCGNSVDVSRRPMLEASNARRKLELGESGELERER